MSNFYLRLFFFCFGGFLVAAAVCNALLPELLIPNKLEVADKLAGEVETQKGVPTMEDVLEKMNEHHLSWYYLTDGKGHIHPSTRFLAPNIRPAEESRNVVWRGQPYYEAVAKVNKSMNLHVGFYSGPPISFSENWMAAEVPFASALAEGVGTALFAALCYLVSVSIPIRRLARYFEKRDRGAAVTTPPLAGSTSDIRTFRQLLESRDKMLADKDRALNEKASALNELSMRYERDMTAVKKEKAILYLKDAENTFIERLSTEMDKQATIPGIGDTFMRQLNSEFPTTVEFALFFSLNKHDEFVLVSFVGFSTNPAEVYKGLGTIRITSISLDSTQSQSIEPGWVNEGSLREIAELTSAREIIMVPLNHLDRPLGLAVIFFRGNQSAQDILRVMNRAASVAAKSLYNIQIYEEQIEAARTDPLTGFPNRNYLHHLLPQLLGSSDEPDITSKVFSFFLVEGHDILSINEKFGRAVGDQLIIELGTRIHSLLQQRQNETLGGWGDYLLRYEGAEFLVILHAVDSKKATIFAQRLRQAIEGAEWPYGVEKWTCSIGIATFPEDTRNPEELLAYVETALSYARGQSEKNKIAHIAQVPKAFRSARLASNLGGSLDVFDPAALMQSLSISRKSGILTVTHPDGKMFWCYLENGRPTKARLVKFKGSAAIIEFLVLFDAGDFNFTDYTSIERQTLEDIRKLERSFDTTNSLEKMLMDGALARDHYISARDVIKHPELFVWPRAGAREGEALSALRMLPEPPTLEEERAISEILRLSNGKMQLKHIFEKLDTLPTHSVWRGAALLLEHEMIVLKKLATSIGV